MEDGPLLRTEYKTTSTCAWPVLEKNFVTRMLTRDLFAVVNLFSMYGIVVPVEDGNPFDFGLITMVVMIAAVLGVAVIAAIVCYRRRRIKPTEGE